MAAPLMVGMTPGVTVEGSYIIRITALDATTGNVVSGVNVTSAAFIATDLQGSQPELPPSPVTGAYTQAEDS